ncbi:MAG: LuxR C-terminal-related transcriptional regulator [Propionivibrio sp.]
MLQLLDDGHAASEVGIRPHIAISTAEAHRRNIKRKLELHSIAELTKQAVPRSGHLPADLTRRISP